MMWNHDPKGLIFCPHLKLMRAPNLQTSVKPPEILLIVYNHVLRIPNYPPTLSLNH